MDKVKSHLVAGAGGMIGSALTQYLNASSERVVLADLWDEDIEKGKIHLNLASNPSEWVLPDFVKTVYICSGITKLEECRRDPTGASRVNVEGTIRFAEIMLKKGAFVVFLSSNQVFDGTIANVPAHHPQNPQNEYGCQKTAVENYLSKWPKQAAIIRLTKVVGPDSIFFRWAQSMLKGHIIHPFTDMVVSPIPLIAVISILRLIGDRQLGGIWQISGEKDIAYSEAASLIAKNLGVNINIIKSFSTVEAGLNFEINPDNTTMDTTKLSQKFGLTTPSIDFTIKQSAS